MYNDSDIKEVDKRDFALLGALTGWDDCGDEPMPAKCVPGLMEELGYKPYSRVRDEFRTLITAGWVEKVKGGYRLTDAGFRYLARHPGYEWMTR